MFFNQAPAGEPVTDPFLVKRSDNHGHAENSSSQGEHLGQQIDLNVMLDEHSNGGSNRRNRRFYPNDFKVAIYLELLSKTAPPVLHRGVSKATVLKFGVPLRVVQSVCGTMGRTKVDLRV
ncbi:hypothetical protein GUJ93_ZPchr0008g13650 [Zizania palustris]|uniref:Uncharacterized protein n=1 Tax=Zizania palustris TaxID=103762 RepID=A0A8J5RLK9_ZIZPA|nr:hypothetical protein GUJ93_ZPchr0008g13650 [Zizania palustris]